MAKTPKSVKEQTDDNTSGFLAIIKGADPEYASVEIPEVGFIDTGSYSLNALISGSLWGGIPGNRVTLFAGDPSTGKTFFSEAIARHFQKTYPTGGNIWWDTEFAQEKSALKSKGMDINRFVIRQPLTIQDFRTDALKFLKEIEQTPEKKRVPVMFTLDSLGNLPTRKEVEDSEADSDTRDMTKQQIIRSVFRVLTNRLGMVGVPLILTTHTYESMSLYTPKEISGGGGAKYAASTIITLSKSAEKNGDKDVVGAIITARTYKSRYTREKQSVEIRLSFENGLDRYWGLIDMAIDAKIWRKAAKGIFISPDPVDDEKPVARALIERNPERYFTGEVLKQLEIYVNGAFKFGGNGIDDQPLDEYELNDFDDVNNNEVHTDSE